MSICKPTNAFSAIIDKPDLKEAFVIIFTLFSTAVIRPIIFAYPQYVNQPMISYVIMISIVILLYLFSALAFFVEAIYLKIVLNVLGIKEGLAKIATLLAYTLIPSIIYNAIILVFPKLLVTTTINGKIKVLYSKISLGYYLYDSSNVYPMFYNIFKSLNIFSIWSNVLEIIALSVLCKFTYRKALMILVPYWLLSALIPLLLA